MLWFNKIKSCKYDNSILFKYISCYGSTKKTGITPIPNKEFKYISCYGSTDKNNKEIYNGDIFKYISCYGSTKEQYNKIDKIL